MSSEKNRIMIVTGANSGMGLASTIALAKTGATVIMLCRDLTRGRQALSQAKSQSGSDRIVLMLADLADLNSVADFCKNFHAGYDRLDVLINNAGVITPDRKETRQGLELVFGVNHIGHFLLTLLLSDLLIKTAGARVVVVSSGAHKVGRIHFDDINLKSGFNTIRSYSQSKLANNLFTRELAHRMSMFDVSVNCCHPGAVATNMGINRETGFGKTITGLLKPFFRTPEKGAETAVSLALTPSGQNNTGAYFYNNKPARASKRAMNDEDAKRLWQLSLDLVEPWLKQSGQVPDCFK
jgi:NAD(P)-dependent dehydrogenase (short-subunit alcohol dehydrogenase family)